MRILENSQTIFLKKGTYGEQKIVLFENEKIVNNPFVFDIWPLLVLYSYTGVVFFFDT
jgi:hypothetical protein